LNGLAFAYIGDAYYELEVRKHLIESGFTSVNILHNKAINYTSSKAQAEVIEYLINSETLSEDEMHAFKRGRNNSSSGRKNVDAKTYVLATGFESLIGYLYVNNKKRLDEIMSLSFKYIEEGEDYNE